MKVALITTDNREHHRKYELTEPWLSAPIEALLEGFQDTRNVSEAEIHVLSCIRQPMDSPEKLGPNIWYHPLLVPKIGWMTSGYQGCIRAVRCKLREIQPDIVHGQGTERECAVSATFSGFPNAVTIHGNMAELASMFRPRIGSYNWLAAKLENFTLPRTAGVFCNSAYTEALVAPRARRTWRVPNAIRGDFFRPTPSAPSIGRWGQRPSIARGDIVPVLLNIGNITPRKRQVELLDVARKLHGRGCRFEMRFIGALGESEYGNAFKGKMAEAERLGYASYLGTKNVDELITCMDSADGMCHFPSEEAFGLVVAETLARNLKFFGAKLGGIVDIASGVEGAELVDGEDWDGLAAAIERWIANGAERPAHAAAEMKLRYHPRVVAQRHIEIYREVLGG